MKKKKWLLTVGLLLVLGIATLVAYALFIEPTWFCVRRVSMNSRFGRVVQISDIHYTGKARYLSRIIRSINALAPDFVCVTGDLADDPKDLRELLTFLGKIKAPVYGIRGNHDIWNEKDTAEIRATLEKTGGAWLVDQEAKQGNVLIFGSTGRLAELPHWQQTQDHRLLLIHDPSQIDHFPADARFGLILSGHTHGGQIRWPWGGPIVRLAFVGHYDRGLFETPAGRLYVNPGIGTYIVNARLFCRPEITLFE